MSDEGSGSRPKRTVQKTPAIAEHDKEMQKKKEGRERREREKTIKEQEAALVAEEMAGSSHASKASTKSNKSKKSDKLKKSDNLKKPDNSKKSDKSKSTSQATSKPNPQREPTPASDSEERRNVADVLAHEARCDKLIKLIHLRKGRPVSELVTLDLEELEDIIRRGEVSQTPAKATTSMLVRASNIKPLGSPIVALKAAKRQSENAAKPSPLAPRRKRDPSPGHESTGSKRPRTSKTDKQKKPTKSSKPHKIHALSKPNRETSSRSASRSVSVGSQASRSTSSQSSASRGSSSSAKTTSSHVTSAKFTFSPDDFRGDQSETDGEVINLQDSSDEGSGSGSDSDDEGSDDETKPIGEDETGSKQTAKGKKRKPKTSDYTGVPRKLINVTFKLACVDLATTNMFPDPKYYDSVIRKSWRSAAAEIRVNAKSYPIEDDHVTVVKGRINSFRGRVWDRVKPPVAAVYGLATIFGEELEDHPGAAPRSGHYEHPFIVEALYQAFFVGRNPPGLRFPKLFDPMPLPAIAFMCAMTHFLIEQYKTGRYKEARAEFDSISRLYNTHLKNANKFEECVPTRCLKLQEKLYKLVMKRAGKTVEDANETAQGPTILTDNDFGSDDESPPKPTPKKPSKPTPKKSSKPRHHFPASSLVHPPQRHSGSMDTGDVRADLDRGRAASPKLGGAGLGWGDRPLEEPANDEPKAQAKAKAEGPDSERSDPERSDSESSNSEESSSLSESSGSESSSSESSDNEGDGEKGEKGNAKVGKRAGLEDPSDDKGGKNRPGGRCGNGGGSGGVGSSKGNETVAVSAALGGDVNGNSGGSVTSVGTGVDVGIRHGHHEGEGGSDGGNTAPRNQQAGVEALKRSGLQVEPVTSTARPPKRSLDMMEMEESEDWVDEKGKGKEVEKREMGKGKGEKGEKEKPAKRKKRT